MTTRTREQLERGIGRHMLAAHRLEHEDMDRPKSRKPARTKRRTGRRGRR